ncbi:DUF3896 domain-containing protein [Bacillus sp. HMF5848]|uniref:DUF3896 family protein n=1 Tax=Bacillus sp. HMF5848 TaxID=2495421 RepID=UPI000F76908F|nr:DUF3896 family protein [Bacillus sp. HMF5848]RSK27538.1 DUF3896 domain-containing protein [Bacillus sp. HMF5848]
MEYQDVKQKLEAMKNDLARKIEDPNVPIEEKERLKNTIENYEYIIELTDMNHFERGTINH